jgi:hypothetical protein
MNKIITLFLLLGIFSLTIYSQPEYCEGDVIFQISKSSQSPFVQYATGSVWSHCINNIGKLYHNNNH